MKKEEQKKYQHEYYQRRRREKTNQPIICKGCNHPFYPVTRIRKFCSIECRINFFLPYQEQRQKRNQEDFKCIFSSNKRKKRLCLNCNKCFLSEGNWNRVCNFCKKKSEWSCANVLNLHS